MKVRILAQSNRAGYALLLVLGLALVCMLIMQATLRRTSTVEKLNDRNNRYTSGLYAAEAATEKVISRMQFDYLAGNLTYVANDLSSYRSSIPLASESPYWGNYQFSDGQGNLGQTYVNLTSNTVWGPLASQYGSLNGWVTSYRVLSNAREIGGASNLLNAVQEDIQLVGIPIFQFAIFYNGLLEFTWCAPFTINGRTHANTNVFVGSASALTFNTTVTTSGTISSPDWFGKTGGQYTGKVTYNGKPGYSTNVQTLTLPIGTNNTAAAVREIINMPPGGEDPNSAMGQQRYYNKSSLLLLVGNSSVTLTLKNTSDGVSTNIVASYSSTNYSAINTNFPFLSLTNSFTDQRESKVVIVSQIDVGVLAKWIGSNATMNLKFHNAGGVYDRGAFPNILYVADNRTYTTNTQFTAVRLVNGQAIPTNTAPSGQGTGFTVATPNPLYVKGHYNCPSASLGSTDTSKTLPASLVSDALTILSPNWVDSQSAIALGGGGKAAAASTTINAAILTGNVPSTGSDVNSFSGGVMNLPRLLEDWGNGGAVTLTFNGSIVNLYNSARATKQFQQPGVYYYAPTRQFSFDQNFTNATKLPPGTPAVGSIARTKWVTPPANTVTYAGN